jgi:hypothetical protein
MRIKRLVKRKNVRENLQRKCRKIAGPSVIGMALTYHITRDEKWGRLAIAGVLDKHVDPGSVFPDLSGPDGINKRMRPRQRWLTRLCVMIGATRCFHHRKKLNSAA